MAGIKMIKPAGFIRKLISSTAFESGISGDSGIFGDLGKVRRKFMGAAVLDFAFGSHMSTCMV